MLLILLLPFAAFTQIRDTALISLFARPFYFNVIKAGDGQIYAGTAEGVFRMEETTPIKIDNRRGYLKVDKNGRVVIDSFGIKFHNQNTFNHLLPYPTEKRDEYHAARNNYLYITSSGQMHIFEKRPYGQLFRNHSVRTISRYFTGTYSGIYYKNRLLTAPVYTFTDSYIREYNGKVFMCASDLFVFNIPDIEDGAPYSILPLPNTFNYAKCNDVQFLGKTNEYIVAAADRVGILDSSLSTIETVFNADTNIDVTLWNALNISFYFSADKSLYEYQVLGKKIRKVLDIDEEMMDGRVQSRDTYILTAAHLYYKQGNEPIEKLIALNKAHTLLPITERELLIATDEGLLLYKRDENKVFTLIQGVEFNRKALHIKDNKIYAGSISGLYVLELNQMETIIANTNKKITIGTQFDGWFLPLFVTALLTIIALILIYRRRIKNIQHALNEITFDKEKPLPTREEIELFITNNLTIASLKSINNHFAVGTSTVYTILSPEKPGDLIQKIRYEKVKQLRKEGKSAKDISLLTGLSDSYIRKIWNSL